MNNENFTLAGQIVDITGRNTYPGRIVVEQGIISCVEALDEAPSHYLLPGFVDAHIHIESSLLVPSEFARLAVPFGTVATVSDPHEIGNVLGLDGVHYMLANGEQVPFKFYFGAPSCVPATPFETAGATIDVAGVTELLADKRIKYLAEMMNWPGVLARDPEVMAKIAAAQQAGKPVDGHAPGLRGDQASQYIAAGISTDHECFTAEEALDKLKHGMYVQIREGSAARNFAALHRLLHDHAHRMMLCSDDKHPDSLIEGHIDQLVRRAVAAGIDVYKVLQAACVNPVKHYGLEVGLLQPGDPADFIVVNNLQEFRVLQTYINGQLVAQDGRSLLPHLAAEPVNQFACSPKQAADFALPAEGKTIKVIEALDGELVTNRLDLPATIVNGLAVADPQRDILKLTVVNRYADAPPAVAFIKGFGLQQGALASSVGHDSHNITAVGVDDESLARAVNLVIAEQGGLAAVGPDTEQVLPLPVAGLMSNRDGYEVAQDYIALDRLSKELGSSLRAPFMTLSFMALLVIPALKLSDKGLFDGERFAFTEVFSS
ncbi:MAG TPA: adenine deaminase [Flammeovirgaceae bacterium]|nr:adenine deaminase [Flammeovirgaceae bacterium]